MLTQPVDLSQRKINGQTEGSRFSLSIVSKVQECSGLEWNISVSVNFILELSKRSIWREKGSL